MKKRVFIDENKLSGYTVCALRDSNKSMLRTLGCRVDSIARMIGAENASVYCIKKSIEEVERQNDCSVADGVYYQHMADKIASVTKRVDELQRITGLDKKKDWIEENDCCST